MRLARGVLVTTSNTNRTRELDTEGRVTGTEGDRSKGIIATSDPHRRPKRSEDGSDALVLIFMFAAAGLVSVLYPLVEEVLQTPQKIGEFIPNSQFK